MARLHKTTYELSESQVTTPITVVAFFWKLMLQRRESFGTVLDLGAGDCRFASEGHFLKYVGVEIDRKRGAGVRLRPNMELHHTCAFKHRPSNYDACIGNPPYVRHHDVESPWKEKTCNRIEQELGVSLNKHCNLYLYFLCLGLSKTKENGLVGLVIPYEWVSRPSAKTLRGYIQEKKWDVSVYRFQNPIFDGVLTTASVSIIDKASQRGQWSYFDVSTNYQMIQRAGVIDSNDGVLEYAPRGRVWGLRGLSPGTQKIFTLTEGERIHFGLKKSDVVPCVTTLKHVPHSLRALTRASFKRHYIDNGSRCWLIKSNKENLSFTLKQYLQSVPKESRDNYTCNSQTPWFKYKTHPVPQLVVGSGFTSFGPKVLINGVRARAIGSVWGVHSKMRIPVRRLQKFLLDLDVEKRVVAHARVLKKIEVRQLNAVLNNFKP